MIDKENKKALYGQKIFGKVAMYAIVDYGLTRFFKLIDHKKVSEIIPKYILDKIKGKAQSGILKKIRKIVGGGVLVDSRKGVKAIQDCISYHKIIKEEYKKIK